MVNIYVSNLAFQTTEDDLIALFMQYGTVARAQIVKDRDSGRSRGYGFVVMPIEDQAQNAIQSLHNAPCNGRPLTVNKAKPRVPLRGGRR